MRKALAGVALLFGAGAVCQTQTTPPKSIWNGVYTEAQAQRGAPVYADQCSRCHGEELEGDEAPALATEEFLRDWKGYTLADLFVRVKNGMPLTNLTATQAADVIAYLLSRNQVPAGTEPIPVNLQLLRQIRMDR